MSVKIARILHAGYLFEYGDTQIIFDPIFENPFSRNCFAFPDVHFELQQIRQLHPQAVFISHYHDDHCSLESLNLLDRDIPIYIFCVFTEIIEMLNQLGFNKVHKLYLGVPIQIGQFEVTPHRALDADVDSIFHIHVNGLNILNVVDSWIDLEVLATLAQVSSWDLVLWPFQTMREVEVLSPSRSIASNSELPPEWIEQLQVLRPKYLVPSSCQFIHEPWSWYNHALFPISYQQFENQLRSALPGTLVKRLHPSISVQLDEEGLREGLPLSWVIPVGDQNLDYQYTPNLTAPPTSEVSKNFPALSLAQTNRVLNYCESEILVRLKSQMPLAEGYFRKPRLWRLSLFNHLGEARAFYYQLSAENVNRVSDLDVSDDDHLDWLTEVSIYKLYAALEEGESLSSMYLRINDRTFRPNVEGELASADPLEDPLIGCLFDGVFGAYQRAQLAVVTGQNSLFPR